MHESKFDTRGQGIENRAQSKAENGNTVWLISRTVYDAVGRASYITDNFPDGTPAASITGRHVIYDSLGRAKSNEQVVGLDIQITGTSGNWTAALASPGTVVTTSSTTYGSADRVLVSNDSFGRQTQYLYDRFGRTIETRIHSRDENGADVWLITRTVYDKYGRVELTTDRFVQPASCALGACASPPVRATRNFYDVLGRTPKVQRLADVVVAVQSGTTVITAPGTVLSTSETIYNAKGQVSRTIAADGQVTDSEYDSLGRGVAVVFHPLPGDDVGLPQYSGNFVRLRVETEYNIYGQRSRQWTNIVQVEDAAGSVITVDRSAAVKTEYEYDQFGHLVRSRFNDGTTITATYDVHGRVTSETDQLSHTKRFEYDDRGNLTAVVLPAVPHPETGQLVHPRYEYRYDERGNVVLMRDNVAQLLDGTILYDHESRDAAHAGIDGRDTQFTFDARGRQRTRTLPDGLTEEFRSDDRGRQTLHISFEGVVTQFIYDDTAGGDGRLVEKRFFDNLTSYNNEPGTPRERVSYTFDALGREPRVVHDRGNGVVDTWTTQYDADGRILRAVSPQGAVNYEYDQITGRRTRTFTGNSGTYAGDEADPVNDFRYEYDALGRLFKVLVMEQNNVVSAQAEQTAYRYDLRGRLDQQTNPNGTIAQYVYDNLDRLDRLTHYLPDSTPGDLSNNPKLAEFDYTVRADGTRSSVAETIWIDGQPNANQIDWTYDAAGRLVQEVFNSYGDSLDQTESFLMDLVGNRLAETVDQGSNATVDKVLSYIYDDNDRLLTQKQDQDNNGTIEFMFTYGWSGTQQSSKTVTNTATGIVASSTVYLYNLRGRMSRVLTDEFNLSGTRTRHEEVLYQYDDAGIRISALNEIDADGNGTFESATRTDYLIDSQNFTGYQQVLVETVSDVNTGAQLKKIVHAIGLDQIIQTTFTTIAPAEGETVIFHYDGHGSTRILSTLGAAIATRAAVRQIFQYDAYGNAAGFDPSAAATSILYSGEQWDQRVAMQYLRERYYDPATGRFNRYDPFAGNFEVPQSLHKYLYTHANPVSGVDPTGLEFSLTALSVRIGIGMTLGAIGGLAFGAARNYAIGKVWYEGWWQNMLIGGLLGGVGVISPWLLYVVSVVGIADSIAVAIDTINDPNATWGQKTVAISLVAVSLIGGIFSRSYAGKFGRASEGLGGNYWYSIRIPGRPFGAKLVVPPTRNEAYFNYLQNAAEAASRPIRGALRAGENPSPPDYQISAGARFEIGADQTGTRFLYNIDETGVGAVARDTPNPTGHPFFGESSKAGGEVVFYGLRAYINAWTGRATRNLPLARRFFESLGYVVEERNWGPFPDNGIPGAQPPGT